MELKKLDTVKFRSYLITIFIQYLEKETTFKTYTEIIPPNMHDEI